MTPTPRRVEVLVDRRFTIVRHRGDTEDPAARETMA
jgi:hypothetical protein